MPMILIRTAALGAALLLLAAPAAAQNQTYRCVAKDGKKYYASAIPRQCIGRPVEVLNAQGTVIKRLDPEADEQARQAKEAALEKKRERETANRENDRRNQALLATYTSERDIDDARNRALADNQKAVRDVESRIETIRKRRAGYEKELEFYKGKTPPQKLTDDMQSAEVELKANEELLAVKKKEVASINTRYGEDKKRYIELTRKK
jgi:uncharacterized protein DUF4124